MNSSRKSDTEGRSSKFEVRLGKLPNAERPQAVTLLTKAFVDDPLMVYIMEDHKSPGLKKRGCGSIMDYSLAIREQLDWPIFSVWEGEALVGLALCSLPEKPPWPQALVDQIEQTKLILGLIATQRLEAYGEIVAQARPQATHIFLGLLGVDPAAQARGIGRMLLDAVQDFSHHYPGSTGVFLDTENERNVAFYERCGYQTVAKHTLNAIDIWCLFRGN